MGNAGSGYRKRKLFFSGIEKEIQRSGQKSHPDVHGRESLQTNEIFSIYDVNKAYDILKPIANF